MQWRLSGAFVFASMGSGCRPSAMANSASTTAGPQAPTRPPTTEQRSHTDDAVRVAAGESNTCVVREGGAIWCWGSFDTKLAGGVESGFERDLDRVARVHGPRAIAGVPPAREIAVSGDACAITLDGEVYCGWLHGAPQRIAGASGATALTMDALHGCAVLADGDVACWSSPSRSSSWNSGDQTREWKPAVRIEGLTSARLFAASVGDMCILTTDSTEVRCRSPFIASAPWRIERARIDTIAASMEEVCLGSGSEIVCTQAWRTAGKPEPRTIAGIGHVVEVGVNDGSLCGRNADGIVFCYEGIRTAPQNARERANAAGRVQTLRMIDVPPSAAISVGAAHSCSISTQGEVHCWGYGSGVSGTPSAYVAPTRLQLERFDELALDGDQSCALVDGRVLCADKGSDCPTGRFVERSAKSWTSRPELGTWTHLHVTGSYYGSCVASRREGPARWFGGKRRSGAATERADFLTCLGTSSSREILLRLPDGTWDRTAEIDLDVGFGCIRTHEGGVECFELPPLEDRHIFPSHPAVTLDLDPSPSRLVPVAMLRPAARLAVGHEMLCTTSATGDVHCWPGAAMPQPGPPHSRGVSMFARGGHAFECQIDRSGGVACRRGDGQLEPVVGIERARSLVAGEDHACALDQLGRVYCWGSDERHVLREARVPIDARRRWNLASPIDLPGEARELFGGPYQTCARLARGPVMCWGANFGGGLGVGISGCTERPIRVPLDAEPAR